MLVAYLFYVGGDLSIETMHKVAHIWQNAANHSHHQSSHHHHHHHTDHHHSSDHHPSHQHSDHQHADHQHKIIGFLQTLLTQSQGEVGHEEYISFSIDKHILRKLIFNCHAPDVMKPFYFSFEKRLLKSDTSIVDPPPRLFIV